MSAVGTQSIMASIHLATNPMQTVEDVRWRMTIDLQKIWANKQKMKNTSHHFSIFPTHSTY